MPINKITCLLLVVALLLGILVACTNPVTSPENSEPETSAASDPGSEENPSGSEKSPPENITDVPTEPESTYPNHDLYLYFCEQVDNEEVIAWMFEPAAELPQVEISDVDLMAIWGNTGVFHNAIGLSCYTYYGSYNGCDVLFSPQEFSGRYSVSVENVSYCWPERFEIWVHKDEELYLLKNAYDAGLLTNEDLSVIAEYHRLNFQMTYTDWFPAYETEAVETEPYDSRFYSYVYYNDTDLSWMLEEQEPVPELEPLSDEELTALKEIPFAQLGLQSVYYGTYNGAYVFFEPGVTATSSYFLVGSKCFYWGGCGFNIKVVKDEAVYTLQEAYYIEKIITDEDLELIAQYHKMHFNGDL